MFKFNNNDQLAMNNAIQFANISSVKILRVQARAADLFRSSLIRQVACLLFTLGVGLLARPCAATPGEWDFTGSLNTGRDDHTATLLPNGKVLVVGGILGLGTTSAELYDPATGVWTPTGSLTRGRTYHTATLLLNGKVLVAGGYAPGSLPIRTAELYDPETGIWSDTGAIREERYQHAASLLPDGRVLIVGGYHPETFLRTAEIYDPATGTWSVTGNLNITRDYISATLLNDGEVLVAGGEGTAAATAELYDPVTGTWRVTGALHTPRVFYTTTLLPNGTVLIAAGSDSLPLATILSSAEVYDPVSELWTETGDLNVARCHHTATLLPNGLVLVAGGQGDGGVKLTSAELYDPMSGVWTPTGSLNIGRYYHAATLLTNGLVLVEGGSASPREASAELYDPGITLPTQASGRGTIDGQGDAASFNFRVKQSGDRPTGSLSFNDPAAGISITRAKVRTLTFNGNSANLSGTARLGNGTRVTYSVSVTDNSSDGSSDTFSITLSNSYSASGTLTSGDIQIQ
jgi:Kelch motif/Galactose oxidase, central domain